MEFLGRLLVLSLIVVLSVHAEAFWHGSILSIPSVTPQIFYSYSPAATSQAIGTLSATNTPTSWTITAGNAASDFAIDNSGNITVTAQGHTDLDGSTSKVDFTLTVTATNASGTSTGVSIPIAIYADGYAEAPTCSVQHATLLNTYHSNGANNARSKGNSYQPPWNVAGVDYCVGYPTGTSLTDWQSISQAGVSVNTGTGQVTVNCSSGAVTLDSIDFSLHGGAYIVDSTNNCNLTVSNSKFGNTPSSTAYTIHIQTTNANLTITNSIFSGGNSTYGGFIGYQASGTVTLKYNYLHDGSQHVIEQVSGSITLIYKYNLVENMGAVAGSHGNWMQWGAIGSNSTADIEYNTGYTNLLQAGVTASEGFQFYANNSGTLTTTTLSQNTMIAILQAAAVTMSYITHGGVVSPGTNANNFIDYSGAYGPYYPNSVTVGNGWTSSGNINMNTGATITP